MRLIILITLLASGCQSQGVPHPSNASISSAHPEATRAGIEILKKGGNAIEAAIAVSATLSVVEPYSSGLGGGGFAIVYDAKKNEIRTFDFREMAPLQSHPKMYLKNGVPIPRASLDGPLAAGTPGLVMGWYRLLETYGNQYNSNWAALLAHAEKLAREGFQVDPKLEKSIAENKVRMNPAMKQVFLKNGETLKKGALLKQSDLSKTLHAFQEKGPLFFYQDPEFIKNFETEVRKSKGILTAKDLKTYEAKERPPILGEFEGLEVASFPPPSSGGIHLLQMMNLLELLKKPEWSRRSPTYYHDLIESMRLAYVDRATFLGDPDFVCVPEAGLASREYAKARVKHIPIKAGNSETLRAGNPWKFQKGSCSSKLFKPLATKLKKPKFKDHHTSHFSIVDREGNAVAITQTINTHFGSAFMVPKTGVILNNEMDDFAIAPGTPNAYGLIGGKANEIRPRKRPLSSMTPTLLFKKDSKTGNRKVFMVTGTPGGSRIITTTLQTILNAVLFQMNAKESVSAPRIHHQWFPDEVFYEKETFSDSLQHALQEMGYRLTPTDSICNAQLVLLEKDRAYHGASDPRGVGSSEDL